mmetsp:Transcript_80401/g.167462  ORF Transcript_80401/g.167462 Transcript_80401/m.167462 type:complete len:85 (-) Transcript_80401:204-458(-)
MRIFSREDHPYPEGMSKPRTSPSTEIQGQRAERRSPRNQWLDLQLSSSKDLSGHQQRFNGFCVLAVDAGIADLSGPQPFGAAPG